MILPARGCDVAVTLDSGQAFRWAPYGPRGWRGVLGDSIVTLLPDHARLRVLGSAPDAILGPRVTRYFGLDDDPTWRLASVDVDPAIHAALAATRGLRILRQDPWECLASFICATFNNILRIQGMIGRLCRAYGRAVPWGGDVWWTFPTPEVLARVEPSALRRLGFGYRAPYVVKAAQQVSDGKVNLAAAARLPYAEAREALLAVEGVGEKVVECVLLFGFGQEEAFPVDVWIGRVMRRLYFRNRRVPDRRLRAFARRHFGPSCGLAQQALFHAARTGALPGV
ncbi:MAG: hypothetical protein HY600_03145 [Candidatus Omnitrophica bacterium]|nr:hypothetical protein [Candidatus Omnitrophota bacterium]